MADATDSATEATSETTNAVEAPEATFKTKQSQEAEPKRSWGDEVDNAPDEEPSASTASEEKVVSELNVEGLTIEEEEKINTFLDEPEDSNVTAVTSDKTPYTSAKTFEDLNLSPELLKGIYVEMKFQKPSKIQAISLPMILTPPYKNLIAQAHNGSGKTTCFALGMLSRVDPKLKAPQALCICPTRELAIQNLQVVSKMAKYTGISSECAVPEEFPPSKIAVMTQIVIGTPGTIRKWMTIGKLSLRFMNILVFDEADHMLDEDGFRDYSLRIMRDIRKSSAHCQVLLFSATFNDTVRNFVTRIVEDYNKLLVKKEELSLDSVKQYKVYCPDELAKVMVVRDRIFELGEKMGQTIIFVSTKRGASDLHKALVELGYDVSTIQGGLDLGVRDKIVKEFKDGLTQVLISTDVLARGFDQQQVNLVINYDLPKKFGMCSEPDYEVYLHRVGRAGRFGRKGAVFNLLMADETALMEKIEKHFGSHVMEVPSWNNVEDFKVALKTAGLL
ncbi:DEAD-box ATP-dependent RNA helicase 38 [Tripterygium wilfordii]|uniref:RNA helicase n=1 Tax=Tripterygium wilfordii TaxID=458696 RepID=A0A7J7CU42_TRIWF|nr:DEAD-box ATP-dependent RNA helicase 38-like [Tripterygium wilfordii]KAF5737508.1 DEAD-box ATP-dependent RNA helicase 38 [Tripterygium wilfordii]